MKIEFVEMIEIIGVCFQRDKVNNNTCRYAPISGDGLLMLSVIVMIMLTILVVGVLCSVA